MSEEFKIETKFDAVIVDLKNVCKKRFTCPGCPYSALCDVIEGELNKMPSDISASEIKKHLNEPWGE